MTETLSFGHIRYNKSKKLTFSTLRKERDAASMQIHAR